MNEMIERVATALCRDEYEGGHLSGAEIELCVTEDMERLRGDVMRRLARLAIEAMREPTERMVDAGVRFALEPNTTIAGQGGWHSYVTKKHQVMINAALSE